MHSPEVLAFSIWRPWPTIHKKPLGRNNPKWALPIRRRVDGSFFISRFAYVNGVELYWPSLIDVWHMEPGGKDALTVCERRWKDKAGKWHFSKAWRWHIWHWHVAPVFIYNIRRRLLTRCAECGGPDRKGHRVNVSNGYQRNKVPIWCSEQGLYHSECAAKNRERHHHHDPRGCYACSGSSSFEFKRQNAIQHKLPLITPKMPQAQREVLEPLHMAVKLGILPYEKAVQTYNNKRQAAQWQ